MLTDSHAAKKHKRFKKSLHLLLTLVIQTHKSQSIPSLPRFIIPKISRLFAPICLEKAG